MELIGRYDDAIGNYEEMREEAVARGDEAMELSAHSSIALLYATATPKFDPELGRRLSEELVVMARRIGDRSSEARALWNIVVANVYGEGTPPEPSRPARRRSRSRATSVNANNSRSR